jgi:hypothetical protein
MTLRLLTGSSLGLAAAAALASILAPACGGGGDTSASASSGASSSTGDTSSTASAGGASSSISSTTGGEGGGGPSGARDVTGTSVTSYVIEGGVKSIPDDLSAVAVEALVPAAGGFTKVTGVGMADGTFKIPAVPAGAFFLHVDKVYVYTSANQLDLGSERRGRPDRVAAAITPTEMVNQIKNVDPYQESDIFEWFVANNDAYLASSSGAWTANPPAPGGFTLNDATIDWASPGAYLVDKDRGDTLAVAQLATRSSALTVRYNTISRFLTFPSVTQSDGKATTINGTFADVPQKQTVNLNVKAESFEVYKAQVGPGAVQVAGPIVTLATAPAAGTYGALDFSATLVRITLPVASSGASFGALKYGNPYPADWGTFATVSASFDVSYLAPNAVTPVKQRAEVGLTTDLATLGAGPVEAQVGPVEGLKVNGIDALIPLSAVTATPTLSWSVPSLGAPTHYEVSVRALESKSGKTSARLVASLFTGATKLTIPEGILTSGGVYVIRVRAAVTSAAALTQPRRAIQKTAFADVLTSTMHP